MQSAARLAFGVALGCLVRLPWLKSFPAVDRSVGNIWLRGGGRGWVITLDSCNVFARVRPGRREARFGVVMVRWFAQEVCSYEQTSLFSAAVCTVRLPDV